MAARYRQGLAAGRQRVLSVLWAPSFIAAALPSTTHGADDGRRQAGGEPAGRLHSPPLAIKSGPSYSPWAAPLSLFVLVEHLAEEEESVLFPILVYLLIYLLFLTAPLLLFIVNV